MELELIPERELTTLRPRGGKITDVHICQRSEGQWHINIRVSWRGNAMFHVGLYDIKRIRIYKRVSSAIRHIVAAYEYDGMIAVHPLSGMKDMTHF